jgi:DNA-binding response OmpR family regulator
MSQQADIILLDLNLKDEDGLEIAKSLRDTGRYGIIMMTTRGTIQQRIDGLATGTDAYLVKPIDIRELVAVIRNMHRRLVE